AVLVMAMGANGCSSNPGNGDGGKDSGGDVKITPSDGGNKDGGTSCTPGSGLSCEQCDTTSFSPTAQAAPFDKANKCPAADVNAYIAACGSAATSTSCGAWQTAEQTSNKNCLSCIYSFSTDANWGPLVCDQNTGLCSYNFPGCLDIQLNQVSQENGQSNGSCGDLFNAGYGCQDFACGACQIGPDGGIDDTSFTACDNSATGQSSGASNECGTYLSAVNSASQCAAVNGDAGGTWQMCFPADSNNGFSDTEFTSFVNLFCGAGP
ncbi:MAG TPA: hypothetical protein VGH28_26000, partial [Polyangiaceae bacterium]